MDVVWKSLFLVTIAIILLRIAGRKSISQMSVATTIVMFSIGTVIVQPIADQSVWHVTVAASVFTAVLLFIEWFQLRFNWFEKWLSGSSETIIRDGKIVKENLKRLRLTVDQLEMRLRERGITNISDVKTATLEMNGNLGYELMRHAQPVTVGDLEKMLSNLALSHNKPKQHSDPLFDEVEQKGHTHSISEELQ